ncbi:MAG: glycosyltransferase [Actinomycetota bacterium]|nr:glycosyltransferase [Actinomycetota bacterium]
MRVGFYLPDFSGGGNERAALMFARHWPPEVETPTILVRSTDGPFLDEAAAACEVVGLGIPSKGWRASLWTPRRLGSALKSRRIDALVGFLSLPSLVTAKAWARDTKLVWSVQTAFLRPTGTVGEGRGELAKQRLQALAVRAALRGVDGFHVPTASLVEGLRLDTYARPIGFVPNGVEPALLEMASTGRAAPPVPRIVSVGRLAPVKRFDVLIEAVRRVLAVRPVELTIYGVGPLRQSLEDDVRATGLDGVVRFGGFEHDLTRVYGDADVFVLASDHEAFGNVVIEALAFGLPAVVTDAPFGPAEIVDYGRYGLVVERGRADLLAEAILQALPGGAEHDRLSNGARARAAGYAAPLVARRLHDFLSEIV